MSYASIIQKDLPLVSWHLDDASLTGHVSSDDYVNENGTYHSTVTKKNVPIIFGSEQSVIVSQNTDGYAIEIPSLDRFSSVLATSSGCLEFWIKFLSSSFSSPTTMTKIVGKPNSITGVYIHNSSIIGIIGDSYDSYAKAVVPVDDLLKPMHIAFSYSKNSVYLSVNGQRSEATSKTDVFTNTYSGSEEHFRFVYPGSNLEYALDTISIYSRVLDHATCIRHLTYGLGYEVPKQVSQNYGGVRYNLAMAETPLVGKFEKGDNSSWQKYASMSNVNINDGYLVSTKRDEPQLLFATDKDSSVFSWTSDGLEITEGGYVYIPYANTISQKYTHGFGIEFNKANTISSGNSETLVYINNPDSSDKYIKFFINGTASGEELAVQMNNKTPVTLLTGNPISGLYSVGYFYDESTQTIHLFAGKASGGSGTRTTSYSDKTFNVDSIRVGSEPVYSNTEAYSEITAGLDKNTNSTIKKIVHLSSLPSTTSFSSIYTAINTAVNNYTATASYTEKRFIISSVSTYEFNLDLKRLSGNQGFIGNNIVEWGNSGEELSVSISGEGYDTEANWLASTSINNRMAISELVGITPGTTKYLNVQFSITSNDLVHNPTKIFYFRILSYPTTTSGTSPNIVYSTNIVSDGPDIAIKTTSSKYNISLPSRNSTPFLYNNECGGIYVPYTAVINYDTAPISGTDANSGIYGISMFINIPSGSNKTIFSVTDGTTTRTLSYTSPSTLSCSGATIYVNGSATSTITANRWEQVTIVFNTRMLVQSSSNLVITFGGTSNSSGFYIDEIMTFDKSLTSTEASTLNKIYKGTNIETIGDIDTTPTIVIYDSEISNTTEETIYQPIGLDSTVIDNVNLVTSSTISTTYNTTSDLIIDGVKISVGDRILHTTNGVYTITGITKGGSITKTGPVNTSNAIVYVEEGNVYRGKHFRRESSTWEEAFVMKKIKAHSKPSSYIVVNVLSTVES